MPFEKGNKLAKNQGRKGYDFEKAQLEKMQKVLDKDLKMIDKLQNEEDINPKEKEKLLILQARVLKIYDKLHASKSENKTELNGNLKVELDLETKEKIEKAIDKSL